MMRGINWVIANGLMATVLWLGGYRDVVWAKNVFLFMVWVTFFLSIACLIAKEARQKLFDKGPSVPTRVAATYDTLVVLAIAALGWFFLATIYAIASCVEYIIFAVPPEDEDVCKEGK